MRSPVSGVPGTFLRGLTPHAVAKSVVTYLKPPFQEALGFLPSVSLVSLHQPHFESFFLNKIVGAAEVPLTAGERGVLALTGCTGQPYSSGSHQLG